MHFWCQLDGLSKIIPCLLLTDNQMVKAMSLGDEEGHQRKKRKQVVETKEENSQEDDNDIED